MKKSHSRGTSLFLTLTLLGSLFGPLGLAFAAEFNPNFLVSDEEMQAWDSMTRTEIDLFLDEKGSYLRNFKTEDKEGKNRTASDIIYRASKEYKINPKYLLVKLQKEQSLITEDDPTQKQLDWATGYGVCDACKMDDPKIQKYKGFGNQIDYAAGIMRWYYDNSETQTWIKQKNTEYIIDGQPVIPANNATAFLYTYTPHLQGNQNFWILWQKWFDQVYPDGSLIQGIDDTVVYLLQDGKKRPFKSMSALATRFDPKRILMVPSSEVSRYPLGAPINFPNYSLLFDGSKTYLLDYDTLRPFDSETTVRKIGYNPDEIIEVEKSEITSLPVGKVITLKEGTNPSGELLEIKETKSYVLVKNGTYHSIIDPQIAKFAFPSLSFRSASIKEIEGMPAGDPIRFPDGTLIKVPTSPKTYVIEHGKKRHIANEQVFLGLGYKWENIITTNDLVSSIHPIGSALYLRDAAAPAPTDVITAKATTPVPSVPKTSETNTAPKPTTDDKVSFDSFGIPKFVDTGLMYAISPEKTKFIGKKFETPVNTYLVADAKSGNILAGKNIDVIRPIASFTKVMTGYTLFEKDLSLTKSVTYNTQEHKGMYGSFRLVDGERVKNADLLSTMLVSSNNSAARMIVDGVEPDEKQFIKDMNVLVGTWGLSKTRFTEPSGADLGNISTAREYLTIFQKATQHPTLLQYMAKKSYSYDETLDKDEKPTHFDSHSNHLLKRNDLSFRILASKTGYLIESGTGLAMLVERKSDKKQFIIITMGNNDHTNRFVEPEKLTNWALKTF